MRKFLFLLIVCLSCNTYAQKKMIQIDSLLSMLHEQAQFNGNVLIIQDGEEILKKSYGLANRETKESLNENSVFELASVSKQFTAAGIILLNRKGLLSYEDRLTKYFPELNFCKNVRIKTLLNHSSGIPEYFELMMRYGAEKSIVNNEDVIKILSQKVDSLNFAPNDQFEYSNTNYLLLASIIERITQSTYPNFMKENIFQPLGMNQTSIYNRRYHPQNIPNCAHGYVMGDQQTLALPDSLASYDFVVYLDGILGDGMVNSTINDLRKWDQALRSFSLIRPEEFEFVKKLDTLNNGSINTYSFGWNFNHSTEDIVMSHSGGWPGYVSYISRSIHSDNLMVILQNFDEVILPIKTIKEILNEQAISTVYKKEIQLSDSILKRYTGNYLDPNEPDSMTTLSLGKNALIFNSTNNPWDMPFYPSSENTFFSKAPRMNLGFEFVEEDQKMKLIFIQNNKKIGEAIKQ